MGILYLGNLLLVTLTFTMGHSSRSTGCRVSDQKVDCSFRNLKQVPDLCTGNISEFILSGNNFVRIHNNTFSNCTSLKLLALDKCSIHRLDPDSFIGLSKLNSLNLSRNLLGWLTLKEANFWKLKQLKVLDISHQTWMFSSYDDDPGVIRTSSLFIRLPYTLQKIYARNSFNIGVFKKGSNVAINITNKLRAQLIDLSDNNIQSMTGTVELEKPSRGFRLDMSGNNCKELAHEAFGPNIAYSIIRLNLRNNRLGNMVRGFTGPFPHLVRLQILDLSQNEIIEMHPHLLSNNTKLRRLRLVDNNMLNFSLNLDNLNILDMVDISKNKLRFLSENAMKTFDRAFERSKQRRFVVRLDGNPLECSCESRKFLRWLHDRNKYFHALQFTHCYIKGNRVNMTQLKGYILPYLERKCLDIGWLYATLGFAGLLAVLLCISVFIYRFRWDIKYAFLQFRIRRALYEELSEEQGSFVYDAFVAHCESDIDWVCDELLPNIEECENPMRLCIHHRDFVPGIAIEENIVNSISNSRKTLLVLSQGFMSSGWCKFEMHMARLHLIERGVDKLVLVLLGDVPVSDMPRTLVNILRKQTYIEWPRDGSEGHVTSFWPRLRSALKGRHFGDSSIR